MMRMIEENDEDISFVELVRVMEGGDGDVDIVCAVSLSFDA